MRLTTAHRTRPKRGEAANGDAVVLREDASSALFAVIDALGHGAEAAHAASRSVTFLREVSLSLDVRSMMLGLHQALRGTRGAAATVCVLKEGVLTGCGIGNVEMRSRGTSIPFALSPGILGANCTGLRPFRQALAIDDRIALFSDGVRRTLSLDASMSMTVDDAAHTLFERYASDSDDATLLLIEAHA